MSNIRVFTITENGFSMTDNRVCFPACKIKAVSYVDAKEKYDNFLSTQKLTEDIELITPMERIDFDYHK